MSNSTAQVLMKKGKRGAAAYIHADCASGSPQHLGPLLDVLLNPSKAIDEWETIDWCRWLIAGGRTPDEFATVVRSYDKHDKCGLVWIPRVVAYRCRTCGISPCMSICRECFHRGDHSTHDFNMFLSQAGGACDCGDNSVMKEDGFCSNHGNKCPRPGTAPAELMCVAEGMMPRLILRLLQHFRENSWGSATNSDSYRRAVNECEGYVNMLMELNNMGDLMRSAMTKALINPQMYRNLAEPPFPQTEYGQYMAESKKMYEKAIESFPAPEPPDEYKHLPALSPHLQHNTLLDEFIFWTFKYEFPQNIVCFLLNMLPDQDYKEHLTRTFVLHYARIPLVLEAAADPDTLSNRVVHMSVQLFSNEALALRCVEQLHLLHVMVLSLKMMMGKILVQNTLHDPEKNFHYVIDCTRRVMKEHCYWPLVSDFNNVLSHGSVALLFLQDDKLLDMWFEFLSMLQGMNVNVRETSGHIEFEPSSYYAAFSCELEAAAYPMWSVLSHLQSEEHAPLCRTVLAAARRALHNWHATANAGAGAMPTKKYISGGHASFHFPLHRHLAAFLCCGVRSLGLRAADVLPPPRALHALAMHPLSTQALFYEILAGIWVRNGLQIKGQAMTYIQANFCNSMVDMDIYWLQICAAHLPPDDFINMCIDTFNVREWLSLEPMSPAQSAEQDAMVEGLLTFLAILVSSRTNLGNDELTQSRLEVSTLLAAGDKTHSQLLELMPERSGNAHTRNFETVLKELSTYRPPPKGSENLEQGLFVPKPIVWEQYYDPLHVLRRAVHRRDYHASMERFTAYVKEKEKVEGVSGPSSSSGGAACGAGGAGGGGGALWPPLRDAPPAPERAGDPSNLCSSGVLCGAILAVLARYTVGRAGPAPPSPPPDHVLALAVYLLYTAVRTQGNDNKSGWSCLAVRCAGGSPPPCGRAAPPAPPLLRALRGDVSACARQHVHSVPRAMAPRAHPPEPAPARYHTTEDEVVWEGAVPAVSAPPNTSTALVVPPPMQMVRRMDIDTDDQSDSGGDPPQIRSLEDSRSAILALVLQSLEDGRTDDDTQMSLAIPSTDEDTPPIHEADFELEPEWSLTIREESPSRTPALPAPEPTTSTDTQLQLHQDNAEDDMIVVNESIISLLLKLHSQLSGKLDSFSLDEPAPERDLPIGDGCYWIGRLLHALCERDRQCGEYVMRVRQQLWPHQRERQAEQAARERREKEERSRRARARQEAVMAEFARRQQQFLSTMHTMHTMESGEEMETETPADYHCVICNTTAESTAAHPLGRVVLLQSTSVLGHSRANTAGGARLALNEAERTQAQTSADHTRAAHHARLQRLLQNHFPESWELGVSTGWSGGVHLASCGHHLHVRCLHAYLRSLAAPSRPHNLHVERGEFLCPVCRQLANSVLPLSPGGGGGAARSRCGAVPPGTTHETLAAQVQDMLDREHPHPPAATKLSEAMGKAMEEMTATAGAKLKQEYGSSPAAIFTFVASLVRSNLECELVQRGGTLVQENEPRYKPRNECIVPLIEVVSAHARVLVAAGASLQAACAHTWRQLCGPGAGRGPDPAPGSAPAPGPSGAAVPCAPRPRPMPLLLKDPLALLMHFILLAPQNPPYLDIQHFICIVRALYALTYYQIVCQFLARVGPGGRTSMAATSPNAHPISHVAHFLMVALSGSELFTEDGPPTHDNVEHIDVNILEEELQELLLPYLRICSLLRQHLYADRLPDIVEGAQEFVQLTYYLELVTEGVAPAEWSAARALPAHRPPALLADLVGAAEGSQLTVRRLLSSAHVRWLQPALVSLPRDYERLFTYYHERVCAQCGAAPKEASVCLLCGTLVCLKQPCCRRHQVCEAVQHAMECGGGTGIFLVVTSTYIIVIRGRRACLWGSLYLDDYDEEDRDLKRGKPLYLSQDRLELLQAQWLAHRFDHTKRTWVWHRDSL